MKKTAVYFLFLFWVGLSIFACAAFAINSQKQFEQELQKARDEKSLGKLAAAEDRLYGAISAAQRVQDSGQADYIGEITSGYLELSEIQLALKRRKDSQASLKKALQVCYKSSPIHIIDTANPAREKLMMSYLKDRDIPQLLELFSNWVDHTDAENPFSSSPTSGHRIAARVYDLCVPGGADKHSDDYQYGKAPDSNKTVSPSFPQGFWIELLEAYCKRRLEACKAKLKPEHFEKAAAIYNEFLGRIYIQKKNYVLAEKHFEQIVTNDLAGIPNQNENGDASWEPGLRLTINDSLLCLARAKEANGKQAEAQKIRAIINKRREFLKAKMCVNLKIRELISAAEEDLLYKRPLPPAVAAAKEAVSLYKNTVYANDEEWSRLMTVSASIAEADGRLKDAENFYRAGTATKQPWGIYCVDPLRQILLKEGKTSESESLKHKGIDGETAKAISERAEMQKKAPLAIPSGKLMLTPARAHVCVGASQLFKYEPADLAAGLPQHWSLKNSKGEVLEEGMFKNGELKMGMQYSKGATFGSPPLKRNELSYSPPHKGLAEEIRLEIEILDSQQKKTLAKAQSVIYAPLPTFQASVPVMTLESGKTAKLSVLVKNACSRAKLRITTDGPAAHFVELDTEDPQRQNDIIRMEFSASALRDIQQAADVTVCFALCTQEDTLISTGNMRIRVTPAYV